MAETEIKVVEITLKNKSTARQTYYDDKGKGVSINPGETATFMVPEAIKESLKDSDVVELTTKSAAEADKKAAEQEQAAKRKAAEEAAEAAAAPAKRK